jgi:hypothetical protein
MRVSAVNQCIRYSGITKNVIFRCGTQTSLADRTGTVLYRTKASLRSFTVKLLSSDARRLPACETHHGEFEKAAATVR